MKMHKCLLCKRQAKYSEFSPDGKTDYFCSKKHYAINNAYWWAKGISWRALPLEKIILNNKTNK